MSLSATRRTMTRWRFPVNLQTLRPITSSSPACTDIEDDEDDSVTPWVRTLISGVDLMRRAEYNKGMAFTEAERDRLHLRGLLPPAVLSQEVQAERVMMNLRNKANDLEKHTYLSSLQERNERLFYYVMCSHTEELVPLLGEPTLSKYCQKYSLMFRSVPRGMFLSLEDKGRVASLLKNWPERRVKVVCLTDGHRVGTLGDLGVQAIGVPISRLALYTACGGLQPSLCLPVTIDVGTDNEELLQDPIYVGARHRRISGDAYFELVDEFLTAVRQRYGSSVLVNFEGMSFDVQSKLINSYRRTFPCYSDSAHGLPTTVLAGLMAALPATGAQTLEDHKYMLVGEGPQLTAIAELLEEAIQRETRKMTVWEARERIHLVDKNGLVCRNRGDVVDLEDHKLPYVWEEAQPCPDLLSAVRQVKPTVLIGLTAGAPPPFTFTQEVCEAMAGHCQRPVIMPLSLKSPTGEEQRSELAAQDAYAWTQGRCLFADRLPMGSFGGMARDGGGRWEPRPAQTLYFFPGMGLGTVMSRSTRLREEMMMEGARALARLVTEEDLAQGALYPPVAAAREISMHVAAAVAGKAYHSGVATELPRPHDLLERAHDCMYWPMYCNYR